MILATLCYQHPWYWLYKGSLLYWMLLSLSLSRKGFNFNISLRKWQKCWFNFICLTRNQQVEGWKPLPFQTPAIHHARTNRDRKAKTPSDPVIDGPVISSHCRSIISVAGFHLLSTLVHYATGNFCLADKLVNIWIATGKAGVYWEHRLSNYADANNETVHAKQGCHFHNSQPNSIIFVTTFIDNLGLCPWSRKWFNINDVIFYDITTQWGSNNSSHCQ